MSGDIREWEGGTFDPRSIRFFSLLPDEDADEAYCVRHEQEMRQIDPIVHTDGALYTTNTDFSVYTCTSCIAEIGKEQGVAAYRSQLIRAFDQWDRGEALGDWFQYIGEGSIESDEENDAQFVAFGGSGE